MLLLQPLRGSEVLAGLLLGSGNGLGGTCLALLGLIDQVAELGALFLGQGLEVAPGRAAGGQVLGGLVELGPVVPGGQPHTTTGADGDQ